MLRNRDKEEEGFKHLEYRVAFRRKKEEKIIVLPPVCQVKTNLDCYASLLFKWVWWHILKLWLFSK